MGTGFSPSQHHFNTGVPGASSGLPRPVLRLRSTKAQPPHPDSHPDLPAQSLLVVTAVGCTTSRHPRFPGVDVWVLGEALLHSAQPVLPACPCLHPKTLAGCPGSLVLRSSHPTPPLQFLRLPTHLSRSRPSDFLWFPPPRPHGPNKFSSPLLHISWAHSYILALNTACRDDFLYLSPQPLRELPEGRDCVCNTRSSLELALPGSV